LLVVEVLLKQTRAESVAKLEPNFFEAFPSPASLAAADTRLEDLIRPLGFAHQRSSQLRALATVLCNQGSNLGDAALNDLPGIGRYSSGMVAAAMRKPDAVAVDVNIARVVCRVFGIEPTHAEARKSPNVWNATRQLVDRARSRAVVLWAILDLAALVCVFRSPRCQQCPLARICTVGAGGKDPVIEWPSKFGSVSGS
jgi:A/G-specific adenine glycosylase